MKKFYRYMLNRANFFHSPASYEYKTGGIRTMKTTNLKLLKAPADLDKSFATKSNRIPSDFFDPLARKQNELKAAFLLIDCLNSYIKNPLFPDKLVARRAP